MYFASKDFVHVSDVRALARVLAEAEIRARTPGHQDDTRSAYRARAMPRDTLPDDRALHGVSAPRR